MPNKVDVSKLPVISTTLFGPAERFREFRVRTDDKPDVVVEHVLRIRERREGSRWTEVERKPLVRRAQKFLCVNGPRAGQRVLEARDYYPFNCAMRGVGEAVVYVYFPKESP